MKTNSIDRKEIERLLPHREPMLLIDKLINIVPLKSARAIVNVVKTSFFLLVEKKVLKSIVITFH